ncbi:single-stranded DNA-binding protein [bacterium]|jgi:single-strand DNA-binding protein|nr:single-stranded DNA-binding protein [bacterium]MBT3581723.1 single-stranded DNA-binding protein [bacterium]MBT4551653.1 single-stranded DNA-binding protein [bacterium]MBT5989178.1 single-stranded DNA-binding protein [bacterium]MBT7088547.1 single-stranded DNA-binding protein [bacterium]
MYNKVFLIGRLVRDPEMRLSPSGIAITRFTIAIDKPSKKENQEQSADFIRIVAFRRLAEICNDYLKKGRLVSIEGKLQISSYEKDGEQKTSAEIIADNMQILDRHTSNEKNSNETQTSN